MKMNDEKLIFDITLDEVKQYLKILNDDENEVIKICFFGAVGYFETYTQRKLSEFSELPREVRLWLLYKCAGFYEIRASASDARANLVDSSHIDIMIDFYRKSPIRLGLNEFDRIQAQLSAQTKLLKQAYAQILEIKNQKSKE